VDCPASFAFAATGALEGITAIFGQGLLSLSEQQLIDCGPVNNTNLPIEPSQCVNRTIKSAFD